MTSPLPEPHLAAADLSGYAAGALSAVDESFVETHLLSCAPCRSLLSSAAAVDARRVHAVWNEVVDVLDRPRAPLVERVLHRFGATPETARLVAAAPSLRLPWLTAVAACLLLAASAASAGGVRGSWLFLTLAPLVPVAGVAAAYGPHTDPAWELARATSYSLARLTLLRIAAVLASTLPLAMLVGLLIPGADWWVGAVWLLPAAAFVTLTLWVGTYLDPLLAAGVLTVGWCSVTTHAMWQRSDPALLLHPALQLACAGVAAIAAVGLWSRRDAPAGLRWPA